MDVKKIVDIVKSQNVNPDKIARFIKTGALVTSSYYIAKLIISLLVAVLIFIYLIYKGLPLYIGAGFILLLLIILILEIVSFKRIRAVKLNEATGADNAITISPDEQVRDYIVGIMKTGFGLRGFAFLDVGKVKTAENALLITDRQVIFIVVPLGGADKLIAGTDIGMWQWLLSKNKIEEKMKNLLASNSLTEVIKMHQSNFSIPLDQLKVKFGGTLWQSVCFYTENKKFCYSIRDKNDYNKSKAIFSKYLTS